MTENMRRQLREPFTPYELFLLDHIASAQAAAAYAAQCAQDLTASDQVALHAYVEHMAALEASRAYSTALWEYRRIKSQLVVDDGRARA